MKGVSQEKRKSVNYSLVFLGGLVGAIGMIILQKSGEAKVINAYVGLLFFIGLYNAFIGLRR